MICWKKHFRHEKKSQIMNTFKFMYLNRKPFRDGKTGSRPTAAAASYIVVYNACLPVSSNSDFFPRRRHIIILSVF